MISNVGAKMFFREENHSENPLNFAEGEHTDNGSCFDNFCEVENAFWGLIRRKKFYFLRSIKTASIEANLS